MNERDHLAADWEEVFTKVAALDKRVGAALLVVTVKSEETLDTVPRGNDWDAVVVGGGGWNPPRFVPMLDVVELTG